VVRTDTTGFKGKVNILVGAQQLPDQDADIEGSDRASFSAKHTASGRAVAKITAGGVSGSALLDLDKPSDP
jgi:hypothetical protein